MHRGVPVDCIYEGQRSLSSTRTNASTVVPVSRSARSRRSSTRTTLRRSGRTTTRRTSSSSTSSVRRAAPAAGADRARPPLRRGPAAAEPVRAARTRAASVPSGLVAPIGAARDRGVCRAGGKGARTVSAVTDRLPTFPWDRLEPYKETAAAHPGGIVDLSVGTPVDPVPELIQKALVDAADSPGYPTVWGTPALRDAPAASVPGTSPHRPPSARAARGRSAAPGRRGGRRRRWCRPTPRRPAGARRARSPGPARRAPRPGPWPPGCRRRAARPGQGGGGVAGEGGGEQRGVRLVLGVGVREGAALHALGGVGQRRVRVAGDLDQVVVNRPAA
ncbi:hypothetical protein SFUMM280S_04445 [Streptomyces fumanus]